MNMKRDNQHTDATNQEDSTQGAARPSTGPAGYARQQLKSFQELNQPNRKNAEDFYRMEDQIDRQDNEGPRPHLPEDDDFSLASQVTVMSFRDGSQIVRDDIDQYFLIVSCHSETLNAREISSSIVDSLRDAEKRGDLRPSEVSFEEACQKFNSSSIRM